jgi:predicted naringenin-chalcone synthase
MLAFDEQLVPDSADAMTWVPGPYRFEMRMSAMVAVIVRRHLYKFVDTLLAKSGIDVDRDKARLVFAIHPAGPTTLDDVQDELDLRDEQIAISKAVFYENGNMSSATIPHILEAIVAEQDIARGTRVVCLGVGPGLTLSGLVLEKT